MLLAAFAARAFCWLMVSFLVLRLFLPRCRTLHFSLLNFMRFPFPHFSTSLKSTKACYIVQTYQNKETTTLQTGFLNSRPEVP